MVGLITTIFIKYSVMFALLQTTDKLGGKVSHDCLNTVVTILACHIIPGLDEIPAQFLKQCDTYIKTILFNVLFTI